MRIKATAKQFQLMVEFLENNRSLLSNENGMKREEIQKKWKEITDILNSQPSGACKSEDKWRKSFQDWKGYVKKKASMRYAEKNKTRKERKAEYEPLSELEERLYFLTGSIAADGDKLVDESDVMSNSEMSEKYIFPQNQKLTLSWQNQGIIAAEGNKLVGASSVINDSEIFHIKTEIECTDDEVLEHDVVPSTSSSTSEIFNWNYSTDNFKKRRLTITEDDSNNLIESQEGHIVERQRLADVPEQEDASKNLIESQEEKIVERQRLTDVAEQEDASNNLNESQDGQIVERQRLADVAEQELQIAIRKNRLRHQKLMYNLRLHKLKYL